MAHGKPPRCTSELINPIIDTVGAVGFGAVVVGGLTCEGGQKCFGAGMMAMIALGPAILYSVAASAGFVWRSHCKRARSDFSSWLSTSPERAECEELVQAWRREKDPTKNALLFRALPGLCKKRVTAGRYGTSPEERRAAAEQRQAAEAHKRAEQDKLCAPKIAACRG